MTDKKKGNAFTNNPLVRAIGVQKIVVVIVLIAMLLFFSAMSPALSIRRSRQKSRHRSPLINRWT